MIPGGFEYHQPGSVEEVIALLGEHGDEGRVLAGGHSLIPMMKMRMAAPSHLIDLKNVAGLAGVADEGGALRIGPMTTQADIIASSLLADKCPILRETSEMIADPQVRYLGTMGGNVANGDPGNDMPAVMMALGATYELTGPNGKRSVAARDYYEAAYFTALEEGELLTAVNIPTPAAGHGHAYAKLKRKVGDYATAAAAVIVTMDGGKCTSASIALTNVGDTALYAEEASQSLVGTSLDDAAIAKAVELAKAITNPVSDMRGTSEYRTEMAGVMCARAIATARDRAQ